MPKYQICLTEYGFKRTNGSLLGAQFIEILDSLEAVLPPHIWYGGNIDATDKRGFEEDLLMETRAEPFFLDFLSSKLRKIGSLEFLREKSFRVFQFCTGIFAAFEINANLQDDLITCNETRDYLNVSGILIEVRIDDEEGLFLLCSSDYKMIKTIVNKFQVKGIYEIENDSSKLLTD